MSNLQPPTRTEHSLVMVLRMKAAPGRSKDLRRAVAAILAAIRSEDGCFQYDFHQHRDDESHFTIYEVWRDDAALASHRKSPQVLALMEMIPDLTEGDLDRTELSLIDPGEPTPRP